MFGFSRIDEMNVESQGFWIEDLGIEEFRNLGTKD
jgi:hypothetical protein